MTPIIATVASLVISFFLQVNGRLETTSFNFSSFRLLPESISFLGHGFLFEDSLELNNNSYYSYGRAFYTGPVRLWENKTGNVASFSTHFSFSVFREPSQNGYSDGLVFFLAPFGYEVPNNSRGSGFTVFGKNKKDPAVAVEFDTCYHDEVDPITPHLGIDVGSEASKRTSPWDPFNGRSNFTAIAYIAYDPASSNLTARFINDLGDKKALHYVFDLRKTIPENATIGFAATTGGAYERHVVHSWSFSSSLDLPDDIANPTTDAPPPADPCFPKKNISLAAVAGGTARALAISITTMIILFFYKA